ncbi:MAG: T9SS type A sorting domain-containing protein [Bacteroidetes bacterium]|nr:T9SS type A sorting domain-containing protein [Bacteroidota bacterium]
MRKLILWVFLLLGSSLPTFAQYAIYTSFDYQYEIDIFKQHFYIDSLAHPNSKWQLGHPNKTVFNAAFSNPNALVTDTLNALPPNDTSVIYFSKVTNILHQTHGASLKFEFQLDGDSADFGTVELSLDSGRSWIDPIKEDKTYNMHWIGGKPTLKGTTNGWKYYHLDLQYLFTKQWDKFPIVRASRVLLRFTYITDSDTARHDGWIIDDFKLIDNYEAVPEIRNDQLIAIYPNPVQNVLYIQPQKSNQSAQVQIYNYAGQLVLSQSLFNGGQVNMSSLPNGFYMLKYVEAQGFAMKSFVIRH